MEFSLTVREGKASVCPVPEGAVAAMDARVVHYSVSQHGATLPIVTAISFICTSTHFLLQPSHCILWTLQVFTELGGILTKEFGSLKLGELKLRRI